MENTPRAMVAVYLVVKRADKWLTAAQISDQAVKRYKISARTARLRLDELVAAKAVEKAAGIYPAHFALGKDKRALARMEQAADIYGLE